MVHGDDNSSLPHMTFVSRYPWCLGVLVLLGLLTLSSPLENEKAFPNSPVPTASHTADSPACFAEDVPSAWAWFEDAAHQPQPFRAAIFHRAFLRIGKPREALSKASFGGPGSAKRAGIETWQRCARLAGRQRSWGVLSLGPGPDDARGPFIAWNGFPPTVRLS
jgi:hypothetical protein